jgi:outer membrane receptor protein involved in Fe transport
LLLHRTFRLSRFGAAPKIGAALLLALSLNCALARTAAAQMQPQIALSGTIKSSDGAPIAGASITLSGNGPRRSATSDRSGQFQFANVKPGTYLLEAIAKGYTTLNGRTIQIEENAMTTLALTLPRAQVSSLTTIGSVTTNGLQTLSTQPAPTLNINTQPYAQQGVTRTSDILQDQLSTTVYPIIGGGLNAPAVVSLRGPDPSETLVDIDGHQANNGSTGDIDLSLLDPADLQSLQVVYGIAPSALYGPNTLGGALNVVTLEPTTQAQTLLRFTAGSYDTFAETLHATGTDGRFGYAASYHRMTSGGQLFDYEIPTTSGAGQAPIGNDMTATTLLGKLRYTFGGSNGGFIGVTFHDQSVYRDLSATLSSVQTPADGAPGPGDSYSNFSGSSASTVNLAYGFDAQVPLGRPGSDGIVATTAIFRHQTTIVNQSVNGPGAGTSPYLYNNRDLIGDDTLEIDRTLPHGSLDIKGALTEENLQTDFIPGVIFADSAVRQTVPLEPFARTSAFSPLAQLDSVTSAYTSGLTTSGSTTSDDAPEASQVDLGQIQRWLGLSYHDDPTSKLHYSFAAYYSNFSTFGSAFDPRFGFVWTPNGDSAVRISAGNTFQSPQLPTFIVPPTLPPPVDGYISIGNPHATAERATSYNIGYEHLFHAPTQIRVALDLYRTDLHNGVATYFAPPSTPGGTCSQTMPCISYPVNVTQEVYQGLELRTDFALWRQATLRASYDIDSVYTQSYPTNSADDVPLYEQALGVPLHKISLVLEQNQRAFSYYVGMLYEGAYNELNLPPFATLRAGVTFHAHAFDVGLYGTNLTNVYNFPLTRVGAGVPYGGLTDIVPTNAIPLPGPQITLSLSRHT